MHFRWRYPTKFLVTQILGYTEIDQAWQNANVLALGVRLPFQTMLFGHPFVHTLTEDDDGGPDDLGGVVLVDS